jgi:hypothetical protein
LELPSYFYATVMSEPALYFLRSMYQNLMPIFRSLDRLSKESVHVRGTLLHCVTSCGMSNLVARRDNHVKLYALAVVG